MGVVSTIPRCNFLMCVEELFFFFFYHLNDIGYNLLYRRKCPTWFGDLEKEEKKEGESERGGRGREGF